MENKKIVIHQPSKYGDFLNIIPIIQKLIINGYDVWFPHCSITKDLLHHFPEIKTFEVGGLDVSASELFAERNEAKFINCQSSPAYNLLCTIHGGKLFIEELKYYVVNDNVELNIEYQDKFNFTWKHNIENEKKLFNQLNIGEDEEYVITHTIGDNGRVGIVPANEIRRRIEIIRIDGYSLLDWYQVIQKSQAVYTIQSSAQCFIDNIKHNLNKKIMYLLNDTSNPERLLVPAYDWDLTYFINKKLK